MLANSRSFFCASKPASPEGCFGRLRFLVAVAVVAAAIALEVDDSEPVRGPGEGEALMEPGGTAGDSVRDGGRDEAALRVGGRTDEAREESPLEPSRGDALAESIGAAALSGLERLDKLPEEVSVAEVERGRTVPTPGAVSARVELGDGPGVSECECARKDSLEDDTDPAARLFARRSAVG